MRLIDADALAKEFEKAFLDYNPKTIADKLIRALRNAPTVDAVEVVRGEWIDMGNKISCSVCGGGVFLGTKDPGIHEEEKAIRRYCSHCGTKMDGERKDND